MTAQREVLQIFERDNTVTSSKLRRIGYIPATVYGKDFQPISFQVKAHEFQLALGRGVREFTLEGMGQSIEARVQQLQKESTKEVVLHAEFLVKSPVAAS